MATRETTSISPSTTWLGWIGTGVMGRSMAGHLQKAGHRLHVHNRTKEKAAALLEAGATWHDSAGSVREQPFSEIWPGARAADLRRKILRCKGCWIECDINPSVFYSGDIEFSRLNKLIRSEECSHHRGVASNIPGEVP